MKTLIFMLALLTLTNCDDIYYPKKDIVVTIDTKLPVDANGYSYFTLYTDQTQNIHTVAGTIRVNGKIPDPEREKVEWESSHYWVIHVGDTIGHIYRRTWKGLGWQLVGQPIQVINLKEARVPTINPVCYNESDGTIHNVIAPVWEMRGDTMTIVANASGVTAIKKIIIK